MQIGLAKLTKLSAVFDRYVEFCNERRTTQERVEKGELEFVHSELLNGHHTTEAAALMKNDRITVRRDRTEERAAETQFQRTQRETDKNYFKEMKGLFEARHGCDVLLDCQGTTYEDVGQEQRKSSSVVRCHSFLVSKRCPFLGRFIIAARQEQARQSIVSIVESEVSRDVGVHREDNNKSPAAVAKESEDEDDIGVLNFENAAPGSFGDAQIVNDDDDDEPMMDTDMDSNAAACQEADDVSIDSERPDSSLLRVTLPHYSPDAVKILLEYCYTNRVASLGYEAFAQACKTKLGSDRSKGPCPPHPSTNPRRRPKQGAPHLSFQTILDAMILAEDAGMPRLSLMCEVAAAQLVGVNNIVEALSTCEKQKNSTENPLPRLRKAAMDIVLRSGPRGVYALPAFLRSLEERSSVMVPSLLAGTAEAVLNVDEKKKHSNWHAGSKRDWKTVAVDYFDEVDYADAYSREQERHQRRIERLKNDPRLGGRDAEREAARLFEKPRRRDDTGSKHPRLKRVWYHLSSHGRHASRSHGWREKRARVGSPRRRGPR